MAHPKMIGVLHEIGAAHLRIFAIFSSDISISDDYFLSIILSSMLIIFYILFIYYIDLILYQFPDRHF